MTKGAPMEETMMKRTACKILLCLLLAILLLTGCAGPAVTPQTTGEKSTAASVVTDTPAQDTAPPESSAPPEARYAADYALLWDTLERDYPYLDYLRGKGIDVDGIRAAYEEQMKQAQTPDDLAAILEDIFRQLQNTAHLFLIRPEEFPYFYSVYTDEDMQSERFLWSETVKQAAQAGYYKLPADGAPHEEDFFEDPPQVTVRYYPDCKLLYLRFFSFVTSSVERDRDVLVNAVGEYPEAEHIVFDIAQNGGGDDRYWRQNLVAPFGEDYQFPMRMYCKDSPRNRQILESLGGYRRTAELEDAPAWAEALGLELFYQENTTVEGRPEIQSGAKRWLLVGPKVYSSAEMFVSFCQATGWATVAGTHTWGDGVGFDPVLVLLPDSGLLFRFSLTAGEAPNGSMSVVGTEPELTLPGSGFSYLLDYIRKTNKG